MSVTAPPFFKHKFLFQSARVGGSVIPFPDYLVAPEKPQKSLDSGLS